MAWKKLVLLIRNRNNRPRCKMLDLAMDFVRHNNVQGDYYEFGVFAGSTFQYAYHAANDRGLKGMRFHGFDSFAGFSEPRGHDDIGLITQGTRNCSEQQFLLNIKRAGVPLSLVTTTNGWFAQTLDEDAGGHTKQRLGTSKIAVAWMDADLYEPTVSALNFITDRLQDGSVLLFDNWFLFKGHPERGERKALSEWQFKNPHFTLTPFYHFGWHGTSFVVSMPLSEKQK